MSDELNFKVKKSAEKIAVNVHIVGNDTSLAFFRIQEHVRKVLPAIVDKRNEVIQLQNKIKGHVYDIEYAASAVKGIEHSDHIFKNIQEMIKTSIFLKQQLKYEEVRNRSKQDKVKNSVYKRFSAHITLDLPEFRDFSSMSQRVETMISTNRASTGSELTQSTQNNGTQHNELQRSHTTLH